MLCFLLLLSMTHAAETGWTADLGERVRWMRPAPAGVLLVGTPKRLVGLDGATGGVLWSVETRARRPTSVALVGEDVVYREWGRGVGSYRRADLRTGEVRWSLPDTTAPGSDPHDAFDTPLGTLLVDPTEGITEPALMMQYSAVLVDSAGGVLWSSSDVFEHRDPVDGFVDYAGRDGWGPQQPLYDAATGTLVECWTRYGSEEGTAPRALVRARVARTGATLWTHEAFQALNAHVAPALTTLDGVVFVPTDNGGLTGLDLLDGSGRWSSPLSLPGRPRHLAPTPSGLAVSGDGYVVVVDAATGKPVWEAPYEKAGLVPEILVEGDEIVAVSSKRVLRIATATGEVTHEMPLLLMPDEAPVSIEERPGGYLITTERGAYRMKPELIRTEWKARFAAPGPGTGDYLQAAALLALSMTSTRLSKLDSTSANDSEQLQLLAGEAIELSGEQLLPRTMRFHGTDFVHVLARIEMDGRPRPVLMGIDKDSGEALPVRLRDVDADITLSRDGRWLYRKAKSTVRAAGFDGAASR